MAAPLATIDIDDRVTSAVESLVRDSNMSLDVYLTLLDEGNAEFTTEDGYGSTISFKSHHAVVITSSDYFSAQVDVGALFEALLSD